MLYLSFAVLLCSVYGGDKHNSNTCASSIERFIFCFGYIICFEKQFKPVTRFICFLKCDLQFCYKVRFSFKYLTRSIMDTAKFIDCVLNLLSDIKIPPIRVNCTTFCCDFQWLVKFGYAKWSSGDAAVKYRACARSEVKCATHDKQALHLPKAYFTHRRCAYRAARHT